jgi:2-deoxy-D-gluconate 3-dehydrogenase
MTARGVLGANAAAGSAGDVAGAFVFLTSSTPDNVHGIVLPVDGGWLAR